MIILNLINSYIFDTSQGNLDDICIWETHLKGVNSCWGCGHGLLFCGLVNKTFTINTWQWRLGCELFCDPWRRKKQNPWVYKNDDDKCCCICACLHSICRPNSTNARLSLQFSNTFTALLWNGLLVVVYCGVFQRNTFVQKKLIVLQFPAALHINIKFCNKSKHHSLIPELTTTMFHNNLW